MAVLNNILLEGDLRAGKTHTATAALIAARGFCLPRSALITLLRYRAPRDRLLFLAAPLGV